MKSALLSTICASLHLLSCHGFVPQNTANLQQRTNINSSVVGNNDVDVAAEAPATTSDSTTTPTTTTATSSNPATKNKPNWEVKQHLYGLDMITKDSMSVTVGADGNAAEKDSLPLPETYITCGKCKALFALKEEDLGKQGKGCRVKCTVCSNSWFQSRDRLFDIPTSTHDMLPAHGSDLDRIARNLARDQSPSYQGVHKLYVGNLDFSTTSEQLLEFFESHGKKGSVCDANVIIGPDGRSKGFAFLSFYDEEDGKVALEFNGLECNGRDLSVREPNNNRP